MILYEKEVIDFLGLPSIPKKAFDGKTPFEKGVAVITLVNGGEAYAVCAFNPDNGDTKPSITKVFGQEPFTSITAAFVVPNYMTTENEVSDMDLDEESKKRVSTILEEATELENEDVNDDDGLSKPKSEYYFDNITNDDEAKAFIQSYNSRNKIKGRIPTTHDGLVMRLAVIYSEVNKANK